MKADFRELQRTISVVQLQMPVDPLAIVMEWCVCTRVCVRVCALVGVEGRV